MNTIRQLNDLLFLQKEENFTRMSLREEFSRYMDVRFGDVEKVQENLKEILAHFYEGKGILSDSPLRNTVYHLVVSAAMLARICIEGGMPMDESYTLSDIYIRKADHLQTPESVIDLICEMHLDYARRMRALQKKNSLSIHIRNSLDYINAHLHEPLSMEKLAELEGLHPSYYSKLFMQEVGIPAKAYLLKRKILEARKLLIYSDHSLSEIALALGFSSQSAFTTAFRKETGMTPGTYRKNQDYREVIELPQFQKMT